MGETDFTFAWEGAGRAGSAWSHLRVARIDAHEEISRLFRYELHVASTAENEVDPYDLVGKRATLRIATPASSGAPYRLVHGVIVEAADVAPVAAAGGAGEGGQTYRLVLAPPLARAGHRRRCRIFLDKTLRQIVEAVLTGDPLLHLDAAGVVAPDSGSPAFSPATEAFTWRVRDASRLDDVRARPYVVQYNESDLDFVQRLLEAEGLAYHHESGEGASLLVISDLDVGRPRASAVTFGAGEGRVEHVHVGARQRPSAVVVDDYNWKKPRLAMTAKAVGGADASLTEYHYPGGYPDAPAQGQPLATALADRYAVEASFVEMSGTLRVLGAGSVFALEGGAEEGEYLVTSIHLHGEQAGVVPGGASTQKEPFRATFTCARRGAGKDVEESRFRPAKLTKRPRIVGTQTAVVTAEPSASGSEVHVGGPDGLSVGCVRLLFHWDTDATRLAKEPSSAWVRVNQPFAGVGEGGVWHPRVGVECIVDFEEGDPDRPIVVGRLFNGAHLPPRTDGAHSTMKSFSTPGGGAYNELAFQDNGGSELFHLHAGKDHTVKVGNNRSEAVACMAKMSVGADNSETIGTTCDVTIGGHHTLTVGAAQSITVAAASTTTIAADSTLVVGASKTKTIGAEETITVGTSISETITGAVSETYGATKATSVGADVVETYASTQTITVAADVTTTVGGAHSLTVNGARLMHVGGDVTSTVEGDVTTNVNGVLVNLVGGEQVIKAPSITYNAPFHILLSPFEGKHEEDENNNAATSLTLAGLILASKGDYTSLAGLWASRCAVEVLARGLTMSVAGATPEDEHGLKLSVFGIGVYLHGITLED